MDLSDLLHIFDNLRISNYIGGTVRYIFGNTWRTIFNKPKFTYKEYISGPRRGDFWDKSAHGFNNFIISLITILIFAILINELYYII